MLANATNAKMSRAAKVGKCRQLAANAARVCAGAYHLQQGVKTTNARVYFEFWRLRKVARSVHWLLN